MNIHSIEVQMIKMIDNQADLALACGCLGKPSTYHTQSYVAAKVCLEAFRKLSNEDREKLLSRFDHYFKGDE